MEEGAEVRRKVRPAQRLYIPPAQRNKKSRDKNLDIKDVPTEVKALNESIELSSRMATKLEIQSKSELATNQTINDQIKSTTDLSESTNEPDKLVILYNNERTGPDKNELEVDKEREEMQRAIVNINRKSRPLIKHVHVKNDVLQIDVKDSSHKSVKKTPIKLVQVANWEDLILDDEQEDYNKDKNEFIGDEKENDPVRDEILHPKMQELEHVIELYDFPSTFKTQDIMQIYNEINKESMYIKWCDETHALLVLGSSIQAQRALDLRHDIIKSRPMTIAGSIATQVASKCDLKPAMKRPQTSMHAARRMITTALGAKTNISKEEQAKERETLRLAKELRRTQKQNEKDAWEGHPRPSTA